MPRILIAGYQHETNTFAPSLADWAAFTRGDSFPAFVQGRAMQEQLAPVNIPIGGFIDAAKRRGWTLVPSCWAGAIPSSFVTRDAFERIAGTICRDVTAALAGGLDGIYLDLHGAAVAEHAADSEGELLARLRAIVGPGLPIVASLDLHANVTHRMLAQADALVSYRTYPHVDMADTGVLAADLLARRLVAGQRLPMHARRLPYLIPQIAEWMLARTTQGWIDLLEPHAVPCAPILTLPGVFAHQQVVARGMQAGFDVGAERPMPTIPNPMRFDGERAMADQPPPKIDQQGDAIRAALAAGKGWPAR